ncbi:hypothetical protein OSB04_007804 [Centaurea solstitialis]|uniref:Uncharacterized protein n=1 Tax=Centaurea solstitialis TaxID=347529 RepID=A0AA38TM96_9ASTR|nr:hypothetical protein OSB04_007804 [Centaurea solstitialis]
MLVIGPKHVTSLEMVIGACHPAGDDTGVSGDGTGKRNGGNNEEVWRSRFGIGEEETPPTYLRAGEGLVGGNSGDGDNEMLSRSSLEMMVTLIQKLKVVIFFRNEFAILVYTRIAMQFHGGSFVFIDSGWRRRADGGGCGACVAGLRLGPQRPSLLLSW